MIKIEMELVEMTVSASVKTAVETECSIIINGKDCVSRIAEEIRQVFLFLFLRDTLVKREGCVEILIVSAFAGCCKLSVIEKHCGFKNHIPEVYLITVAGQVALAVWTQCPCKSLREKMCLVKELTGKFNAAPLCSKD